MNEFQRKVAVVTGAASGIGRARAGRCASAGMRLVLADVEEDVIVGLSETLYHELRERGAQNPTPGPAALMLPALAVHGQLLLHARVDPGTAADNPPVGQAWLNSTTNATETGQAAGN